jgi:hypothetical protein
MPCGPTWSWRVAGDGDLEIGASQLLATSATEPIGMLMLTMRKAVRSLSRERGLALLAWAAACSLFWLTAANALAYDIVNRWSATQIDGGGLQRGDPVTLRWSIVPDGQSYSRSNNSELVDFLDAAWGVRPGPRRFDFTSRPWWTVIDNAYAQYSRVSGVLLDYVPELTLAGTSTGLFGDIRIGGEIIDGTPSGTLADNTFPNSGDMRIDTSRGGDGSIGSYFRTEAGLRNLVIHETGHGVGLGHTEFVNNSAKAVMEGGLRTDIWGLQFDDVYALNRQYGDPRERDGGNDNAITASFLGDFGTTGSSSIGVDATDSVVEQFDDDWVGIDGANDLDWYRFSVTGECFANILLTPVGPTYTTVAQGLFNAAAMSDLDLQLFRDGPRLTRVATVDQQGIGGAEWIPAQLLSEVGDYLIRIAGEQDFNQFYQLDVLIGETPVAGTSADLNLDGLADLADWHIFLASDVIDLNGLGPKELFKHGDLNLDGDNNELDLDLFRTAYDLANGFGAFDTLPQIPEPAALTLIGIATTILLSIRRRMVHSPFCSSF